MRYKIKETGGEMSECLATMVSGNYAIVIVHELEREGYRFGRNAYSQAKE